MNAAVVDEQPEGEPSFTDLRRRLAHSGHQRALDFGAGGVAAGMKDPRFGVPSLARERV